MKKYTVKKDNKEIQFTLIRKNVKNVNLTIKNKEVVVSANSKVPVKFIIDFVNTKFNWIIENISKMEHNTKEEVIKQYKTGEIFNVVGKPYILKVIQSNKESVQLTNENLILYTKNINDIEKCEKQITKWYRQYAEEVFNNCLIRMYKYVQPYNIKMPFIKLRKMKRCFGTCHYNKGFIIINSELIKYPLQCIDYVILHELVHFKHNNHSKDFYNMLTILMSDWKQRNDILQNTYIT